MAKTSTIKKDLIPYSAGTVILTPIARNGRPDHNRSVSTEFNFLASTQVSETRTVESLDAGNGSSPTKDFVTGITYTLTVTANAYNPVFHAVATGKIEEFPAKTLFRTQHTYNMPTELEDTETDLTIVFGETGDDKKVPAADEYGDVNFIVEDGYGNTLVRVYDTKNDSGATVTAVPEKGTYTYDEDTKTLHFSDDYLGDAMRLIYYYEATNAVTYSSNPILTTPEYMVEVFGYRQEASTGEAIPFQQKLTRASITGDVAGQPTQRSRSSQIVYTFATTPIPEGEIAYTEGYVNPVDIKDTTITSNSRPNGVDEETIGKTTGA